MMRHCPHCATKLRTETSPGGIPRRVCPNGPHGVDEQDSAFASEGDSDA